jgi:SWI/SNF-related matrix-associated actin-dependent regulator 1 of chromatin subfamily A
MVVRYVAPFFICKCEPAARHIPKDAGFVWFEKRKTWYTRQLGTAVKLAAWFDDNATKYLKRRVVEPVKAVSIPPPPPGLRMYPFQDTALAFALSRNNAYIALEQGLGKTVVAAMYANSLRRPAVVFCPPFLSRNMAREFRKWSTLPFRVVRYTCQSDLNGPAVVIVPDSRLSQKDHCTAIYRWAKQHDAVLVADEAHRYKSMSAKRTKNLLRMVLAFDRVLLMSGTPLLNRPFELYPLVDALAANCIDFMSENAYGKRYCNGYFDGYGWNYKGESNVAELGRRLAPLMLRMTKAKMLDDLPPKVEQVIVLPSYKPAALQKVERELIAAMGEVAPDQLLEMALAKQGGKSSIPLSTYRRKMGELKIDGAVEYILRLLELYGGKVLVFAHHRDTVTALSNALVPQLPVNAVDEIRGSTSMADRDVRVRRFQDGPMQVLIANIDAAGTGLTLTAASRVVFVEYDWTHAKNEQAADRVHRIGQKDVVSVDYLVFKDSLDESILKTARRKARLSRSFFNESDI